MGAWPLVGDNCIHRDDVPPVILKRETDAAIMKRDDMWFTNLESVESTLSAAEFREAGVTGDWIVAQEDLYSSTAKYKEFFTYPSGNEHLAKSEVLFKIKDYDFVGPKNFHED